MKDSLDGTWKTETQGHNSEAKIQVMYSSVQCLLAFIFLYTIVVEVYDYTLRFKGKDSNLHRILKLINNLRTNKVK